MLPRACLLVLLGALPAEALADRASLPPMPSDPIVAAAFGRSTNDCETLREPEVDRIDLNRDGTPDAIVRDRSQCYRKFGGYFAIVSRFGGRWISLAHETGSPRWLPERTRGWPDFEVPDISRNGRCFNLYRLAGLVYVHAYTAETRPEQCRVSERADAAGLQPVQP